MRRHRAISLAVSLGSLLLLLCVTQTSAAASGPLLPPNEDPFYTYSGSPQPHGTTLKSRRVDVALGTATSTPVQAEQLLYSTTDELGNPSVTVTTVLEPTSISLFPHIVEYLSFYDGLGALCDPSYTLAGGDPGNTTYAQEAEQEELLIAWYLSQGDIVIVPDFEGTGLHWMAGLESGRGALDAVSATESFLGLPSSTQVGLSGYSGGAVAADWASEIASAYAPRVDIVGVAEGGIPANYLDMFDYVNGSSEYSIAIPGMLLGLSRAYGIDLDQPKYLSPSGQQVVSQLEDVCMASVFGTRTLTVQQILATGGNVTTEPALETIVADQTMGNTGVPRAPLLMGVGNSDGTGDGAMVAADVAALARKYCSEGVGVLFEEYRGASHVEAGAFFEPQTGPFLQARFAGTSFVGNCSQIGDGPSGSVGEPQ